MVRGIFVTGTDTGVGKTVVCAALMHRYRPELPLRYWKPVQTGIEEDDDTQSVRLLGECTPAELLENGIRLQRPVSPHFAARLSGTTIDTKSLVQAVDPGGERRLIVEGAGGVLVPLNDSEMMCDLIARMSLPVLIVARSGLGTINHTLLTIEALRSRRLTVVGIVMVGDQYADNASAIQQYGGVEVIGEMPTFRELTSASLSGWSNTSLDRRGRVLELLS